MRTSTSVIAVNRGPRRRTALVLPHPVERGDHAGGCDSARLAAAVRNRADDRSDDRGPLVDAVRPVRDQVAVVVVDPFLAVDGAGALEARMHRAAVLARALERE